MRPTPEYSVMTPDDLDWALSLAAAEGWNPGREDAAAFLAADPEGFFVAWLDGRRAAVISVVNHDETMAFLGLYICVPELRGQGIGLGLWTHAMAHAGTRVIGLDGVPDQEANYAISGFRLASRTHRFEGRLEARDDAALRPVAPEDVAALIRLEASAAGYAKPAFMRAWVRDTDTRRTVVLDRGAGAVGFATIRACLTGHKIGPLVAPDAAAARTLLHGAVAAVGAEHAIVDIPDENTALAGYCRDLGMTVGFSTARMYRGPAPRAGTDHRTIATLELG